MPQRSRRVLALLLLALGLGWSVAPEVRAEREAKTPPELGRVEWQRDFDAALARAGREQRPVFALFQEVPGCQTCVDFGRSVLSHPLLVAAIEHAFVPVAVLNNAPGADAAVLRRMSEPAWNNPVVRLLDGRGQDLIPRKAGIWEAHAIAQRMIDALQRAGRPVPGYLEIARDETRARSTRKAVLETHCFWEGEVCMAEAPGVVDTRAAWSAGREVVEVAFDPRVTSFADVLQHASRAGCAERVHALDEAQLASARRAFDGPAIRPPGAPEAAPAFDQKRHLRHSELRGLELTPLQAVRVNADLAHGRDARRWLTPAQLAALPAR